MQYIQKRLNYFGDLAKVYFSILSQIISCLRRANSDTSFCIGLEVIQVRGLVKEVAGPESSQSSGLARQKWMENLCNKKKTSMTEYIKSLGYFVDLL